MEPWRDLCQRSEAELSKGHDRVCGGLAVGSGRQWEPWRGLCQRSEAELSKGRDRATWADRAEPVKLVGRATGAERGGVTCDRPAGTQRSMVGVGYGWLIWPPTLTGDT